MSDRHPDERPAADEQWFRPPNRKEHVLGAWLFIGFGVFFLAMSYLFAGWLFRWVLLVLGIYSTWHGLRHAIDARRSNSP